MHPIAHEPRVEIAAAHARSALYGNVVAFIAVVTEGSFARAGDRLGVGRSAVSRSVQKLEEHLETRLFARTTRSTSLTAEGERFYASCQPGVERIIQALDDMRELRDGPPRGQLRIASTVGFGRKIVAPLLHDFQAAYPAIALDLALDDHGADFSADRIDVAFRDGSVAESQVIAKQIAPLQLVVCAAPAYASTRGVPRSVDALAQHRCINVRLASGRLRDWEFKTDGRPHKLVPHSHSTFNDPELVLQAVLDGRGLAQLAAYQVCELLRAGRLVTCLPHHAPDARAHYLCYPSRRQLPARVRVFIDYMTEHIRALDLTAPPFGSADGQRHALTVDLEGARP